MARPRKPLRERIDRLAHRDGDHLIWHGQMRGGRPHLDRVGHPARILLDLTDHPDYQIRKDDECNEPRCIDPQHYRVIRERKFKYDDEPNTPWRDPRHPSAFTDRELEDIQEAVEMLNNKELPIEDLDQFQPHIKAEILTRFSSLNGR
ncbi:MAG: hypothetical protein E5V72_01385 [Mesorhizobium sp.]|uniref:hypothetical protein n=1 Tax=Mesorhizobium sp. TaxID=1871066 RepID=UPI000FE6E4F3|nr:hypothetical protein [Mesorhizobium sp.]RWI47557.1 MAG: hypothetical protein EOR15_13840 [Mesorhizobium sp.]RWI69716.1 MAG: hypothetical protein EOR18_21035 [Mesorhizobium sp.]RWI76183.1 MAG: hypothetical protein EOR19_18625 [Mesorhizobium sp.]RWI88191.1 MAG: hypothetical protein EOR20_03895 [Mesorhizobium sp.]RWJ33253.1 MAG: hypothetical protein EOR28_11755 [Mesorhizobium sp.]